MHITIHLSQNFFDSAENVALNDFAMVQAVLFLRRKSSDCFYTYQRVIEIQNLCKLWRIGGKNRAFVFKIQFENCEISTSTGSSV